MIDPKGAPPIRYWVLVAPLVVLLAWGGAREAFLAEEWPRHADKGAAAAAAVAAFLAALRVLGDWRKAEVAKRTLTVIGRGGPAELIAMDEGEGRIALLASTQASRLALAAASGIVRDDEHGPGLPARAFFVERGDVSKLVLRASGAGPFRPIESCTDMAAARAAVLVLLDGLADLHERGRSLGDLRPGSVLLDEKNRPVLLEITPPIGLAPSSRVSNDVARGVAPEPRDDIHVVGSLIYEILSRRPTPAFGEIAAREPLGKTVDPVLEKLVGKCLGAKDKGFDSASELRTALERTPWRNGFLAQLLGRLENEPSQPMDRLERLRAHYFMERVPAGGAGELSLAVADPETLEISFTGTTIVNAAIRSGAETLKTLMRGRVLIPFKELDISALANADLSLVEPAGPVHQLTTLETPAPSPYPHGARAAVARAATLVKRGKAGVLSALRCGAAAAIPYYSTEALLDALGAGRDDDGPFPDVRNRIEDELIERALASLERLPSDAPLRRWLEKTVPAKDPFHAFLDRPRTLPEAGTALEDVAERHVAALAGLGASTSRSAPAARRASARLTSIDAPGVPVLSPMPGAPFVGGAALWFGFSSFGAVPRATTRMTRHIPELMEAIDKARELTARVAGAGEFPLLDLSDYPGDPRDIVLPLIVAVCQARGGRKPLPRAVAFAARVDAEGRPLALGADLAPVLAAAVRAGLRLIFVAHEDSEAAQRFRAERGLDARELALEELPAAPLDEVLRFVEQRTALYYPSVLALEPWRARVILERARTQISGARPDRGLDQLTFLLAALARQEDPRLANMRPVCLADIARCRNSRGQWRLALKAYDEAEAILADLKKGRKLDWLGAELVYELPNQKGACLLHAFAFDIAQPLLEDNVAAKRNCDLVSRHSLSKSLGTLGQLYIEWAVAGEPELRPERLGRARELLHAARGGIDEEERGRNTNYLGHLEVYARDWDAATKWYEMVIASEREATRPDRRNNLQFAELGLVLLEMRRGLTAGAMTGFQAAVRRGELALKDNTYQPPVRARLSRFVGTAHMELDRLDAARKNLQESIEAFRKLDENGGQLPGLSTVIELARLEVRADEREAAEKWIAEGIQRAGAVKKDVQGVSPFAEKYTAELERDLGDARRLLNEKDAGGAAKKLAAVRERIPY